MNPFHALTGLVGHYGYPGLALLVGAEGFGVPTPGQTAIVLGAGYATHGRLTVVGVAVTAFLAAVAGDSVGYLIGRYGGRRLILRHGRRVRLTPERYARMEAVMNRHGPKLVAAARFVDGLRQFNGLVAGATGMPWPRFVLWNAIGAAAWVGLWTTVGYTAGDHLRALVVELHRFQWYLLATAVVLTLAYVAWWLTRRSARDRRSS
ncbi:membrane protein DedA, SNARE-associated domain [Micromonospora sediminicola]|uniref:Membrane protein DedA, SNARE-associated domain n=1 Tax=Micromonospora sediminicola TaxID=946078 RepID=A0A1A9BE29_9ACTN|nr:DedA family protein [Micromonospora sediminicola]SBT67219.1 membrane protein DedA, SNARE-associated domain [Micromonospora sediminicola]